MSGMPRLAVQLLAFVLIVLQVSLSTIGAGAARADNVAAADHAPCCPTQCCDCCKPADSCCEPAIPEAPGCRCCARTAPRPAPAQDRETSRSRPAPITLTVIKVLTWAAPVPMQPVVTAADDDSPARRASCGLWATRLLV